jgi:hypothetical protein
MFQTISGQVGSKKQKYGLASQIIIELLKTSLIAHNKFVRRILSVKMVFTPEQQIFIHSLFSQWSHTSHISRKWQCSAEVVDLKFVLRKILRLSNSTSNGRRTPIISQATVAAD